MMPALVATAGFLVGVWAMAGYARVTRPGVQNLNTRQEGK